MNERRIDLTGCAASAKRGLELRWRLAGEERRSRKEEQGDGGFACRPRDPLQTQLLGTWERPDSESDRAIELKLTTRRSPRRFRCITSLHYTCRWRVSLTAMRDLLEVKKFHMCIYYVYDRKNKNNITKNSSYSLNLFLS